MQCKKEFIFGKYPELILLVRIGWLKTEKGSEIRRNTRYIKKRISDNFTRTIRVVSEAAKNLTSTISNELSRTTESRSTSYENNKLFLNVREEQSKNPIYLRDYIITYCILEVK